MRFLRFLGEEKGLSRASRLVGAFLRWSRTCSSVVNISYKNNQTDKQISNKFASTGQIIHDTRTVVDANLLTCKFGSMPVTWGMSCTLNSFVLNKLETGKERMTTCSEAEQKIAKTCSCFARKPCAGKNNWFSIGTKSKYNGSAQ